MNDLCGRSLLRVDDLTKEEFLFLVDLSRTLRTEKRTRTEHRRMVGRSIALIFEKASTRTRSAFEVAAHDQGAQVTTFGPDESHIGQSESIEDTGRVLGRMFDGIGFRGFAQESIEILAHSSGVPVWNGLTDQWHPTQMLGDILTIRDHSSKPLEAVTLCYLGDGRNNTANSLLVTGALLGLDVRIVAPRELSPSEGVRLLAEDRARASGARLTISTDVSPTVEGADFLYTDIWLSMGEPTSEWHERIALLREYQINAGVVRATGNPDVKFMHCLPSLHDSKTEIGRQVLAKLGLSGLEVTDDVFESHASIVFDQAENRLHTVKATMVAAVGE